MRLVSSVGRDDALLLVEWVHRPESWWRQHGVLRIGQILCWNDTGSEARKTTVNDIIEEMRSARPQGSATPPERVNGVTPDAAWSLVMSTCRSMGFRYRPPGEHWHPNPDVDAAIVGSLRAMGGPIVIGQAKLGYDTDALRRQFKGEFAGRYHA